MFRSSQSKKGQWFIISAVIATGAFLSISIIFEDFLILDSSKNVRDNIDFYFGEVKNILNDISAPCDEDMVAETIKFLKDKMLERGYVLNVERTGCNYDLILLQSESFEAWEGTRPEIDKVETEEGSFKVTFNLKQDVGYSFESEVLLLNSQRSIIDRKNALNDGRLIRAVFDSKVDAQFIEIRNTLIKGNTLFLTDGTPVKDKKGIETPDFSGIDQTEIDIIQPPGCSDIPSCEFLEASRTTDSNGCIIVVCNEAPVEITYSLSKIPYNEGTYWKSASNPDTIGWWNNNYNAEVTGHNNFAERLQGKQFSREYEITEIHWYSSTSYPTCFNSPYKFTIYLWGGDGTTKTKASMNYIGEASWDTSDCHTPKTSHVFDFSSQNIGSHSFYMFETNALSGDSNSHAAEVEFWHRTINP